jgi:hypothetical protein
MIQIRHLLPLLGLAVFALAPVQTKADTPGRHPAYIHARSDLRAAQWISRGSEDPNVTRRLHQADQEIEAAIHEVDRAAIIDHKDVDDHPRIDEHLDRNGRFRRMMELLQKARADIGREEDNPSAIGWRNLAYRHIDKAMEFVHHAARDLRIDRDLGW